MNREEIKKELQKKVNKYNRCSSKITKKKISKEIVKYDKMLEELRE